jgi:hypothetical protein
LVRCALPQGLSEDAPQLSSNDQLRLGSTFHGLHAIAGQVSWPVLTNRSISDALISRSRSHRACLPVLNAWRPSTSGSTVSSLPPVSHVGATPCSSCQHQPSSLCARHQICNHRRAWDRRT